MVSGAFTLPTNNFELIKNINVAGKMRLNEWRGKKEVEFVIEDISF